MKKNEVKHDILKRYGVAMGVGLVATAALAVVLGIFGAKSDREALRILSNAFVGGSGVLIGWWCILWGRKTGSLDWFGYSFQELGALLRSLRKKKDDPDRIGSESYVDYSERMHEKRKNIKCGYLLVEGLILVAVSVVLAVLSMK